MSIIKAHNGKIEAENRKDGGAIFRFTLPLEGGLIRHSYGVRIQMRAKHSELIWQIFAEKLKPIPASQNIY